LQLNSNNINEEEKGENNMNKMPDNDGFTSSTLENFFKQMIELNNITAFGPLTSLMNDPNINLKALQEHGNLLIRFQSNLNFYLSSMINAYFTALNKVSSSSSSTTERTSEEYRKLIINTFEDIFSSLFESPEFSITYNNLANSLIDLTKSYQRFFDANPLLFNSSQQQLSKEEKDQLFYNLYEIKKLSLEIKKKLNEEKNE
jgi:hypothetical protein